MIIIPTTAKKMKLVFDVFLSFITSSKRDNKMPMWVFGLNEENSIVNTVKGNFNGTKVTV